MASSLPTQRMCNLLRQLQRQCNQSHQFLTAYRLASSSSKPSTIPKTGLPQSSAPPSRPAQSQPAVPQDAGAQSPISKDEEFTPQPLDRPLGLHVAPQPGQNTGIDSRTIRQRRDDLVNYDKHLQRRKAMMAQMSRPYYRDWKNMRTQEGKLWIAPERLFKASKALYFPNLQGTTLDVPHDPQDTTDFLQDRISVVKVYSGNWALTQVDTFTKDNEELEKLLEDGRQGKTPLQNVQINIEQNAMKSWLIRLFIGSIKKQVPDVEHETYFMVTQGLTGQIKEYIGMLNSSVGFVYLVDHECKIRWAGSANAEPEERASLARGASRLVSEYRKVLGESHWKENEFDPKLFAMTA